MAPISFGASLGQGLGAGAGAAGTSGLIGTLFGGWTARRQWKYQRKAMQLQQKYALEQMAEQYRLQRDQFDYENEYNSPVNVFNRYRQAGINPAAVLGSSGASLSSTMPMPSAPSGGHVSGGPAIGGAANTPVDIVAASQARYNNAAAENQQSSSDLSDEKAATEEAVRNMLAATVDEKAANTYFAIQKGIYQELVNSKTSDMLDAQISELTARADQLIASSSLSEAQINLVREQAVNTYFDSQLKKAMTATQGELSKYYHSQTGFVSLQVEDLRQNIEALKSTHTFTTYELDASGNATAHTYKVDGYNARVLAMQFGAMEGAARAAREAVKADWENPNQWNQNIDVYWDNINGSATAAANFINAANPLKIGTRTIKSFFTPDGEYTGGVEDVRVPYRP